MTSYLRCLITATVALLALAPSAANGQPGYVEAVKAPPVPANLQVQAGNVPFLRAHAVGTQNYICRPGDAGPAWTLFGPQATLFITFKWFNGDIRQQVMTHFLSSNPVEGGTPRATWQSSMDTSAAWAKAIATSTDPQYVAPGAVAWLLLEVVGTRRGPAGGELLKPTTFIQRVNTSGGVQPSTGCDQSTVGSTTLTPYTTDYVFFKAARER